MIVCNSNLPSGIPSEEYDPAAVSYAISTMPLAPENVGPVDAAAVEPEAVNVVQITIVHRTTTHSMAVTASSPYIEDPSDEAIIAVRNLLVKRFEELTQPPAPGQTSPVWGEWTEDKPTQAPEKIRVPSAIITEM